MTSETENSKNGWPYPDSDSRLSHGNDRASTQDKIDPVEQELADENIAHDKQVTKAIDSALQDGDVGASVSKGIFD